MTLALDLDRIAAGAAGAVTLNGTTHAVKAFSASSIKLLRGATPADYLDIAITIAQRSVPTLAAADIGELSVIQIEAILSIASGDVEEVAKLSPDYVAPDPNGSGPATAATSPA